MEKIFYFSAFLLLSSCISNKGNNEKCVCLNSSDSISVFQCCLNSGELQALYTSYGDTTLTVLGNGYIRTNYPLIWKGTNVAYISPQKLRECLNDKFIVQFTKFNIINEDSAEVSLWLQRQGSGADFFLKKEHEIWSLKKAETYLY